ncbi:MAG: DUF262 domain-containing protein [Candidatus Moeniiplasma glomeromycotorum]|nr:DUF262 domain-containing protein [Candidatus Moeniiplasma glomeromycotorum]MCE8168407.1 DUF262 domain-containing protein [Candidatus Moeniiplasma glomeromycotorum]MCE8169984.1 DUF262 domain-containing protein [Candidatus Moeniiplasma glomeromycotorum]
MKQFGTEFTTFENLFKEKRLIIDSFQRDYSWVNEQWERWVDNVKELVDSDVGEIQFIGNIIFKEFQAERTTQTSPRSYIDYEIIDGQQRITTFFIISLVILNLTEEANPNDERTILVAKIKELLFIDKDKNNPRFITKGKDKTFLDNLIKGDNKGDDKISRAYNFFYREITADYNRPYELEKILNKLVGKFRFVLIKLEEDDDVYEIFEAINNAGLVLTPSDKLKAEFFSKWKEKGLSKEDLMNDWEELKVNCSKDNKNYLNHFFATFLRTTEGKKIAETQFVKYFKGKVLKEKDIETLWKEIKEMSVIYSQILSPGIKYWGKYYYPRVKEIKILDLKTLFPCIISLKLRQNITINKEQEKESTCLEKIIVYYFRKMVKDVKVEWSEIKEWMDDIKRNQTGKTLKTKKVVEEIKESEFFWKKIEMRINSSELEERQIKFLLAKFYSTFIVQSNIIYDGSLELEHIFPKQPKKNWWNIIEWGKMREKTDKIREKRDSIGNCFLLDEDINASVKNETFEIKKNEYGEKNYLRLEEEDSKLGLWNNSVWTPEKIDKRRKYLMSKIKKLDFLYIDGEEENRILKDKNDKANVKK